MSPRCSRIEPEALGKSQDELRLLQAMGWETASIHLGTEDRCEAVLKDLRQRRGNWPEASAETMAGAMETDGRT